MSRPKFKDLADRLAWARTTYGLTQYALSLRAGLVKGHVGQIENRERVDIAKKTAKQLASVLGVAWPWLLDGDGEPPTVAQIKRAAAQSKKVAARALRGAA